MKIKIYTKKMIVREKNESKAANSNPSLHS